MNPEQKSSRLQSLHPPDAGLRRYDLEDRLLQFASGVIDVSEKLPNTRAGSHVAGQLLRAGTSPFGNHGEAQAPESAGDFIHKMKICLKELRETRRWTRMIERKGWLPDDPQLLFVLCESDELIRIFKASVQTAERNRLARKRKPLRGPTDIEGSCCEYSRFKV